MKNILIGGNSFPAVNILPSLLEKNTNNQIFVLDDNFDNLLPEYKNDPRITFWKGTAKDKTLLKNLLSNSDTLINFLNADSIEDYIEKTLNIFESCRDSNLERILHISSSRVYGHTENSPVTEENVTKPADLRGTLDSLGEKISCYYSNQFSLPIVILRIFNIYGPQAPSTDMVPSLITTALEDKPLKLWGNGEQTENLLFVDDLIEAVKKVLKMEPDSLKGEIINIGNLGGVTTKEIADIILSKLSKPQSLISYEQKNKPDSLFLIPSIMKAKVLLAWSPKTDIEKGLEKTIHWYARTHSTEDRAQKIKI